MDSLRIFGLDHLLHVAPADLAVFPGGKANGFSLQGSGIQVVNVTANAGDLHLFLNSAKRIAFGVTSLTSSTKGGIGGIRLSSFTAGRTDIKELTIGFNLKAGFKPSSWTSSVTMWGMYFSGAPTWGSSPGVSIQMWPNGSTPVTEGYYEITYKLTGVTATNRIEIRLDKKLIYSQVINNGTNFLHPGNFGNMYLTFGQGGSAVSLTTPGQGGSLGDELFSIGNMYVKWTTDGAEDSTILGPIEVVPLPLASSNNPPWTPSDGTTILGVLNTLQRHANVRTPYVASDAAQTPLRAKPNVSGLGDSQKIIAVQGITSAYLDAGKTASLTSKWSHNSVDTPEVTAALSSGAWTTQVDNPAQTLTTMPDGTAITKAKLAQLEFVVAAV